MYRFAHALIVMMLGAMLPCASAYASTHVPAAPHAAAQSTNVYLPLISGAYGQVCLAAQEQELVRLLNETRAKNGLPAIPASVSLSLVAQLHVRDLFTFQPDQGTDARGKACNLHSWSAHGSWSPVCYTDDGAYAKGMWNKPREITNDQYQANGYEIAYGITGAPATAAGALAGWLGSTPHTQVILEQGIWAGKHWPAMGVGIYEGYAVVWFGDAADPNGNARSCG